MKNRSWILVGVFVLGLGLVGDARAQAPDPFQPPPFGYSPYLNLLRRGSTPALNYYGIVRPQLQTQSAFQDVERRQQNIQRQILQSNQPGDGKPNGRVPGWNTQGQYYGQNGRIAAGNTLPRKSVKDPIKTGENQTRTLTRPLDNGTGTSSTFYNPYRRY